MHSKIGIEENAEFMWHDVQLGGPQSIFASQKKFLKIKIKETNPFEYSLCHDSQVPSPSYSSNSTEEMKWTMTEARAYNKLGTEHILFKRLEEEEQGSWERENKTELGQ